MFLAHGFCKGGAFMVCVIGFVWWVRSLSLCVFCGGYFLVFVILGFSDSWFSQYQSEEHAGRVFEQCHSSFVSLHELHCTQIL